MRQTIEGFDGFSCALRLGRRVSEAALITLVESTDRFSGSSREASCLVKSGRLKLLEACHWKAVESKVVQAEARDVVKA